MDKTEKFNVVIRGIAPLLQNRFNTEKSTTAKKRHRALDSSDVECENALYKNDKGIFQPAIHIHSSMVKASTDFMYKGKTTFKDVIKAGVIITPAEIQHKYQKWEMFGSPVVIQRARVMKYRPKFDKWELNFTIEIIDDRLTAETLKEILEAAGKYKGLGDWRPQYGRFEVIKFEKA